MFDRKDKPELYELLRNNKSKLGKLSAQEKEEQAASAPVAPHSDSDPIPYSAPPSNTTKPYPKLKIPFPTLKPKEPTGVFQKPKLKPVRPQAEPAARPKINEPKKPVNYSKITVIVVLVAAFLIILYLVFSHPATNPPVHDGTTPVADRTTETTVPASSSGQSWSIRLIYYNNDADGSRALNNMCRILRDKNISVFTINEVIRGASCNSVYLGNYSSLEQAQKELKNELPNLIKVHYKLKNASVVKLEEGR